MRPHRLDEVVGQGHALGPGTPLSALATDPDGTRGGTSVVLWGPPGSGKTTIAKVIAAQSGRKFVELSAVTAGVKDVRAVLEQAITARDLYGQTTVLFLDEIHRFTKAQQDALLPGVENGWIILVAATTENPSFSVITPLMSRSLLVTLRPLSDDDIATLLDRAVADPRGLAASVELDDAARSGIVQLAAGDARRALTILEASATAAQASGAAGATEGALDLGDVPRISAESVETAADRALLRYDRQGDEHYDVISAFIKSIRGSDPDAGLHYLARMIEAGEDPRFIARRLIILAAEDVGLADPSALTLAVSAAEAVQMIGMPEGRIPLAEAVVYLATAPKSNAAYLGIDAAIADVRRGRIGTVPPHLRDAHYAGAQRLGHGEAYRYAHDEPFGVAEQQYLPDPLVGTEYYTPRDRGAERELAARLEKLRHLTRGTRPARDES